MGVLSKPIWDFVFHFACVSHLQVYANKAGICFDRVLLCPCKPMVIAMPPNVRTPLRYVDYLIMESKLHIHFLPSGIPVESLV